MTDQTNEQPQSRGMQSVRTILEGLILAGVLWLASNTSDQAKATVALQTQLSGMSTEIRDLRSKLDLVTSMSSDIAMLKVQMAEHERRIGHLEDQRGQQDQSKRWQR